MSHPARRGKNTHKKKRKKKTKRALLTTFLRAEVLSHHSTPVLISPWYKALGKQVIGRGPKPNQGYLLHHWSLGWAGQPQKLLRDLKLTLDTSHLWRRGTSK